MIPLEKKPHYLPAPVKERGGLKRARMQLERPQEHMSRIFFITPSVHSVPCPFGIGTSELRFFTPPHVAPATERRTHECAGDLARIRRPAPARPGHSAPRWRGLARPHCPHQHPRTDRGDQRRRILVLPRSPAAEISTRQPLRLRGRRRGPTPLLAERRLLFLPATHVG